MNRQFWGIALGSLAVLVLAQVISTFLSVSAFEKTFRESLITKYGVLLEDIQRQVERDLDFGKPVARLSGTEKSFKRILAQDARIAGLYLCLPDGEVLYSGDPEAVGSRLAVAVDDALAGITEKRDAVSSWLVLPVRYAGTVSVARVCLRFEDRIVAERIQRVYADNLRLAMPGLAAAFILVAVVLVVIARRARRRTRPGPNLATLGMVLTTVSLLVSQGLYALRNDGYFERNYLALFDDNADQLSDLIKTELDRVLGYGVPLERMKGAELLLERNRTRTRETEGLAIVDLQGRVLYAAASGMLYSVLSPTGTAPGERVDPAAPGLWLRVKPLGLEASPAGYLVSRLNSALIKAKLLDSLLDVLTILAVALVFGLELARMLSVFLHDAGADTEGSVMERNLQVIRVIAFVFFFSALISLSFLPGYIQTLHQGTNAGILGLSKEALLGFPISAYLFGVTIFIPLVGFLSTRWSTRSIFFVSGALFALGTFASAFSGGLIGLSLARFVAGLGYGGMVINGSNLVMASTTERNRSRGFGFWAAGFASASICAISIGGLIVDRLGYRAGFLVAAASALLLLGLVALFVKPGLAGAAGPERAGLRPAQILKLFRNRSIAANLLFSSVPFSLAYVGIFQYILPLYMVTSGISPANIGRLLTVYGLISLATPLVARIADLTRKEKNIIIGGNLITSLSMIAFFVAEKGFGSEASYPFIALVLLGMGLGGMMIDASEESFLTASREAKEMGEANMLGMYTTVEKVTTMTVPVVAGLLVAGLGYSGSIGAIGVFTLAAVLLFALLAQNSRGKGDSHE